MEPPIRELAENYPARVVFVCALIHLNARSGRFVDAKRQLRELGRGSFSALPFDQEWLYGLSFLAEAAAIVSDAESAQMLYALLGPWGSLNAVDQAEGMRGSVWRYLGLLATTLERAEARSHFEAALEANERMGARPWLARTQEDYARLLLARGESGRGSELLDLAHATYRELGMDPV